ncbi:MAG: heme-binding protein [Pseudomonadales bacterium]|nr:heme-binding protein [Pseudomonadales bacterium]
MRFPVGTLKANIGAVLLLVVLAIASNANALEKPSYDVLYKDGKIEYRMYESYILVETVIKSDDFDEASEEGFDRLFAYISGDNGIDEKISMTAPVQMSRTAEVFDINQDVQTSRALEGIKMSFMLPSEYSIEAAPQPTDSRVTITPIPEKLVAVIRFSGRWTERNLAKNEAKLVENIKAANLQTFGPSVFAAYHPPFMPPFLRRNEIMFEVSGFPGEVATAATTAGLR